MTFDRNQVEVRSYEIWEREGRPLGRDWEIWFQAEAELDQEAETPAADTGGNGEATRSRSTKKAVVEAA